MGVWGEGQKYLTIIYRNRFYFYIITYDLNKQKYQWFDLNGFNKTFKKSCSCKTCFEIRAHPHPLRIAWWSFCKEIDKDSRSQDPHTIGRLAIVAKTPIPWGGKPL